MTLDLATRQRKQAAQRELRAITKHENKARKAKRPPNPKADRGRVRDNAYLAWLRRQPCAVGAYYSWGRCSGHIDAAHIRTHRPGELPTGLQRKPDDCRATPLCRRHHTEQHDSGNELRWWACHGLDPFEVAAQHFAAYQRERY